MIVANPLYDIVFKFLMEDDRIARTILSALLKMEVVSVESRRNEFSKANHENLTIMRLDFKVVVKNADGSDYTILIELQKTWLETETLRFRQYLGAQYSSRENMMNDGDGEYAIPMVTIYLLGHKVGEIEEPVLYVRRQALDYDDHPVTKGIPDPFVDSLTHDSIIVQIPRLHGRINNRLDMVLSFFDQTRKDRHDKKMLEIDETVYTNDADLLRIANRLQAAAADAQMRRDMAVEEEFFSVLEKRDTDIMIKEKQIAEMNVAIEEQSAQIEEQKAQMADLLRSSIQGLSRSGMSAEEIASCLNVDITTVKELIKQYAL